MKKWLKFGVFSIIAFVISSFILIKLEPVLMNAFFTVSGIMFSIGLGLIVTFNLQGIKNKSYIIKIRKNLNSVRNSYIGYFMITVTCFILENYIRVNKISTCYDISDFFTLRINATLFFQIITIYSIFYFIVNFLEIQKLNNEIYDSLNG